MRYMLLYNVGSKCNIFYACINYNWMHATLWLARRGLWAHDLAKSLVWTLKQALHLQKEFCTRNAPRCGLPSHAILVARSLSRRQLWRTVCAMSCHKLRTVHEMRDTQYHACALNNFVVTSRDTLEIKFWTFQKFRHDVARTTSPDPHRHDSPRISTYTVTSSSSMARQIVSHDTNRLRANVRLALCLLYTPVLSCDGCVK